MMCVQQRIPVCGGERKVDLIFVLNQWSESRHTSRQTIILENFMFLNIELIKIKFVQIFCYINIFSNI